MLAVIGIKCSRLDRHFLLLSIVGLTYKKRDDPRMRALCRQWSEVHISEFGKISPVLRKEIGFLPRVPTFQHYATILTEDGEFEKAIEVCRRAIAFGLDESLSDGTRPGYAGRIARIEKLMKRAAGIPIEKKKRPTKKPAPSPPDQNRQIGPFMKYRPTRDDIHFTPRTDLPHEAKSNVQQEFDTKVAEMINEGWVRAEYRDDEAREKVEVMQKGNFRMTLILQPRQPVRAILAVLDPQPDEVIVQRLEQRLPDGLWGPVGVK